MGKNKAVDLITPIIIFFIVLFIYTKLAGPISFTVHNVNTTLTDNFQSQGTGKASAAPDIAVINLGITTQGNSVESTQNEANQASTKIINALKAQGINEKDIKTTNYSINPNYNLNGDSQKITGYNVNQTFEVEAPFTKVNQIVDAATLAGANNIGNVTFKLNDKKELELKNQAREEAVRNAKASAEGLARAAGIKIGRIINITESNDNGIIQPITAQAKDSIETTTNITPGETNIQTTVTLTYQTL